MTDDTERTYRVVRHTFNEDHPDNRRTMAEGLTLDEAQAWCRDPDTSGEDDERGPCFDGYREE